MMTILEPYGKPGVFTNALLQNACQLARMELFGTKEGNVKYVRALKIELEKHGHVVMINTVYRNQVLQSMYNVIWTPELAKWRSVKSKSVSATHMKQFCKTWAEQNAVEINLTLGDARDHFQFMHGIYVVPSMSKHTVPLLQKVFQADATHINWGKYTLFSLYGTTANSTMSPVALTIVYENENKVCGQSFGSLLVTIFLA